MSKPVINYKKYGELHLVEPIDPAFHRVFKTKIAFDQVDDAVARHIGSYLHSKYASDIKDCLAGKQRKERKQELTGDTSSRWAGSITQAAQTQVNLTKRNSKRVREEKRAELQVLKAQYRTIIKKCKDNKSPFPKKKEKEFQAEKARLEAIIQKHRDYYKNNNYPITLGSKKLFKEVIQGKEGSHERWDEKRLFLSADGESNTHCGNQTIKIDREGYLVIKIPKALQDYYNGETHYKFSQRVILQKGKTLIEAHIQNNLAVSYTITCLHGTWYLTTALDINHPKLRDQEANLLDTVYKHNNVPKVYIEPTNKLREGKYALGVDMNQNHLACHRIDRFGNPLGSPVRFDFRTDVSSTHTQAQILHALDQLFHYCERTKVGMIVLEDLKGFQGSKSKNSNSGGAAFRRIVSNMPVSKIRQRIFDRAAIRGIQVCLVNPAYTSQLGTYYWTKNNKNKKLDRHYSASIVIGRRGLGYTAYRLFKKQGIPPEDGTPQDFNWNGVNNCVAISEDPSVLETQISHEPEKANGSILGDSAVE